MNFVIDRYEGAIAVVIKDDGTCYNISKELLPADAKEGDVITILKDAEKTNAVKQEVQNLLDGLFDKKE